MSETTYELERSVGKFDEGDVLEVTARWGDWHLYDVRLEPTTPYELGSVRLTERELKEVATPVAAEA